MEGRLVVKKCFSKGGYVGRLLYLDLTKHESKIKPLNEKYVKSFIGGSGLACRIIYDLVGRDTNPLSPENPLVFMTGPLTGTSAPSCGRYSICAKSPLTGIWGESCVGGFFGPRLKFAGFDGIVILGRASKPTYLYIHDGNIEFNDAVHLVGKTTYETQSVIKSEIAEAKTSVACIGQAGENLVKYASVLNDGGRAAGRTGMGAVMGSKQLKAVAVQGKGEVKLANEEKFAEAAKEATRDILESFMTNVYRELGTAGGVEVSQEVGAMSNKYFTTGFFEGAEKISGTTMANTILIGNKSCFACPIECDRVIRIDSGKYALPDTEGPEYETLAAFGSNLLVDNLEGIAYANYLCNAYGMDTISCGVTIGFTYFLYERRAIRESDVKGLEPKWGDIDTAIELIKMIANRDGLGDILAEGVRYVGKYYGAEEYAVHTKGLEFPFHDPRAYFGMTMCYATSPRGACHMQGDMFLVDQGQEVPELGIESTDRHSNERKAEIAIRCQNFRALYNAMIMCQMANPTVQCICDLLTYATGYKVSVGDVNKIGDRLFNLKRAFNNRMGITRDDDRLPKLVLTPLREGGTLGNVPDFDKQLREYYKYRRWDWPSGKPTREKLEELELLDILESLWIDRAHA